VLRQKEKGRDNDVFFIEIKYDMLADGDWGCDVHPNLLRMSKMTNIIVTVIKLRMNW
jgi:hypothetical protein